MKFLDFRIKFQDSPVIDIRNVINYFDGIDRRRLYEWQQKGYIRKIVNNYYIFSDQDLNDNLLRVVANKIYLPSYVGLESALTYYGFIPEAVFQIKSVTTQRSKVFKTEIANFSYQYLNKKLFWGYSLKTNLPYKFFISTPEKTLLDYFYCNPHINNEEAFKELRLNHEEIRRIIDLKVFKEYLTIFNNRRLYRTAKKIMEFIDVKF